MLGGKSESQFSKTQSTANAYTKESLNGALQNAADKEFGKGWFARLWETSKFKIIDSNEAKEFTNDKGVQAFYHNGTTYFVADGIASTTDLVGLLKHEIGVHALKIGKDDAGFKSILKQLESMRGKNAAVDEAFNDAERAGTSATDMTEEALGYFVEKNPKHKLTDRILAWFKKAIAKLTGNYQFDPADLHKMAREALRKAPDELGLDAVEPQGLKLSASAMKSVDANIKRGNESMNKALLEKTTVHRAMFRAGMGWVDFVWGREGLPPDSKGRRKGAMGISHILEARQRKDSLSKNQSEEILFNLVEAIAKGTEVQRFESENSTTVKLDYKNHQVMLAKSKGSNSWIVTGFELYESGKGGSGYDAPPSTHSKSTLTRNGAGADAENIPQSSNDSIKFSKTQPSSDFELPEETMPQKQQRLWQDMNNRWTSAINAIKAKGGKINESNNVYDAMERMPHIAAERITDFKRDTLNPLIERVALEYTELNFNQVVGRKISFLCFK